MRVPNHTQVPHEVVDKYLPELKGSEIKVLLVIARQTIGWHKQTDRISISQMEEKTGLSNRAVIDASRSLEARGIIKTEIKNGIKSYEIAYEESSQAGSEKSSQADDLPMRKVHRGYEKSSQFAYEESSHTKETITKETKQEKGARTHNDVPEPKPKSEKDVISFFKQNGLGENQAMEFYHHFESQGWIRKNGMRISSWQSAASLWIQRELHDKPEWKSKNKKGNGKPDINKLKRQIAGWETSQEV